MSLFDVVFILQGFCVWAIEELLVQLEQDSVNISLLLCSTPTFFFPLYFHFLDILVIFPFLNSRHVIVCDHITCDSVGAWHLQIFLKLLLLSHSYRILLFIECGLRMTLGLIKGATHIFCHLRETDSEYKNNTHRESFGWCFPSEFLEILYITVCIA